MSVAALAASVIFTLSLQIQRVRSAMPVQQVELTPNFLRGTVSTRAGTDIGAPHFCLRRSYMPNQRVTLGLAAAAAVMACGLTAAVWVRTLAPVIALYGLG